MTFLEAGSALQALSGKLVFYAEKLVSFAIFAHLVKLSPKVY